MNDNEVHSAFVRWLSNVTKAQVIKTHQSGPAPALPYVAVNMTATRQIRQHAQNVDYDEVATAENDDIVIVASPVIEVEWQFSCHAYGDQPTGILRPVRSAIQLSQQQEPLLPRLVIHECSQIRNVPDWLNEQWEPRAQMDVFVRALTRDGFVIDAIEQVPLDIGQA